MWFNLIKHHNIIIVKKKLENFDKIKEKIIIYLNVCVVVCLYCDFCGVLGRVLCKAIQIQASQMKGINTQVFGFEKARPAPVAYGDFPQQAAGY